MSALRVHNFSVSLDGFGTGDGLTADAPFGHAGERLHEWMFATRFWHQTGGGQGGSGGADHAFAALHSPASAPRSWAPGKFGPPGWQDDPAWRGWWGPNPPFHSPVFVLTHRPRPVDRDGGRHHVPLPGRLPRRGARSGPRGGRGQDVRLGGGATVIRDFLAEGLVDHMHLVQVPILLGRGVRIWDGLEALEEIVRRSKRSRRPPASPT